MQNPLADALFTGTLGSVLSVLFSTPDTRLHTREIARRCGKGLGSVQRELKRLSDAGILRKEREGQQVFYSANPDSPIYQELRGLATKIVINIDRSTVDTQ